MSRVPDVRGSLRTGIRIGIAGLLAVILWSYVDVVVAPYQESLARRTGVPRGDVSDMYGPWVGARALFVEHGAPYGLSVTQAIQRNTYGRPLNPANPKDPKDEQRLVYPAPMLILMAPLAWLPFESIRPMIGFVLLLMTIASVPLWMVALGIRSSKSSLVMAIILTLGAWPIVQGFYLQQPTLAVCCVVAAAAACAATGRLGLAGVLLAVSLAKPQVGAPFVGGLVIWALRNWRGRRNLLIAFASSSAALLASSEILLPGWWRNWWENVNAAQRYMDAHIVLATVLGPHIGSLLTLLVVGVVVYLFWRAGHETHALPVCIVLASVAGLLVTPNWLSYNQLVLLPAALWLAFNVGSIRLAAWPVRIACALAAAVMLWPWLGATILLITCEFSRRAAERIWWLPLYTVPQMPIVFAAAVVLLVLSTQAIWAGPVLP